MAIITWHNGEVPKGMEIRQVYGLIFTKDGRILLTVEDKESGKKYSLAGGTPESYDTDMGATLRRELIEEINTTIEEPVLVGYQEIDEEDGSAKYAQVRMSAIIDNIGPRQVDPATGKIYGWILTSPKEAINLINWGEVGKLQIEEAVKIAKEKLGLNIFSNLEENV